MNQNNRCRSWDRLVSLILTGANDEKHVTWIIRVWLGGMRLRVLSLLLGILLTPTLGFAATQTVDISGFAFSPRALTNHVGDTVTWVMQDSVQHTSTSDTGVWNSGLLSKGQTFSFTFKNAGTFSYHCIPHPFMTGSITVQAAANNPPTVFITSPTNGTVITFPATVTIVADASDTDDTVARVEFFAGTNLLDAVTAAPYSLAVTNLTAGVHTLTARATDSRGAATISAPVTITVAVPAIKITGIADLGTTVTISWAGGTGPYLLQMKHSLSDTNWVDLQTTSNLAATVPKDDGQGFFRIRTQ